jgi:hypothetical protein
LPKLLTLECENSENLTDIAVQPRLYDLRCDHCPNLLKINIHPKLQKLFCEGCKSLTEISGLPSLNHLFCETCTNLTRISDLPKLHVIHCNACKTLTEIPNANYIYSPGCTWLNYELNDFDSNINALCTCQAIFKRKLTARKLKKLIPAVCEIYYSPGCKGEYLAKRAFLTKALN